MIKNAFEITLIFSQSCQLNCEYCEQKHSQINMTKQDLKKIISKYNLKHLIENNKGKITFEIFGGEPFNEQTIETFDYFLWFLKNSINKKYHKNIQIKINTNTIFYNEYLKKLLIFTNKIFNLKYIISFDGLWQDLRSPENLTQKIIDNINNYLASCIIKKTQISMSYNGLENQDLEKNFLYIKQLFPISDNHLNFYLIREPWKWNQSKIEKFKKDLEKFFNYSIQNYLLFKTISPYFINKKFYIYGTDRIGCGMGYTRFTILPKGDISPCSLDNDFSNEEKIDKNDIIKLCDNCEIFHYCDKICPKKINDKICQLKKIEFKEFRKEKNRYYLEKIYKELLWNQKN